MKLLLIKLSTVSCDDLKFAFSEVNDDILRKEADLLEIFVAATAAAFKLFKIFLLIFFTVSELK